MDIITIAIIGITVVVSWQAWENRTLYDRLKFQMSAILQGKEYDRMFTSAFLHVDSMHLIFNMFTLYFFMPVVLQKFSAIGAVLIYLASIMGGSLLTLLFHQKESWYTAVGASGGVSGIVFSAIMIQPDLPLVFIFLPFFRFPGWVFGLLYLGYSMFGMKRFNDNIGHAAHLGGSAVGMLVTIMLLPSLVQTNSVYLMLMMVPLLVMVYMAWKENNA